MSSDEVSEPTASAPAESTPPDDESTPVEPSGGPAEKTQQQPPASSSSPPQFPAGGRFGRAHVSEEKLPPIVPIPFEEDYWGQNALLRAIEMQRNVQFHHESSPRDQQEEEERDEKTVEAERSEAELRALKEKLHELKGHSGTHQKRLDAYWERYRVQDEYYQQLSAKRKAHDDWSQGMIKATEDEMKEVLLLKAWPAAVSGSTPQRPTGTSKPGSAGRDTSPEAGKQRAKARTKVAAQISLLA